MLKGKVAIITGGTRGIGYAIAKKFLENNAKVIIFGSRKESVEKAVSSLREINQEYAIEGCYPDLSNIQKIAKTFEIIYDKYAHIDILINNAGMSSDTPIEKYTEEEFNRIIDLNVKAVFNCSKEIVKYLKETKGTIINTSSMVSIYGQPSGCAYPVSKFAVNGMTVSLARELAHYGIRVNAVAPGIINTDMVAALPKEVIEPLIKKIPLGRIGEPEDIANAFLFLASDMASYITGDILSVDGCARS